MLTNLEYFNFAMVHQKLTIQNWTESLVATRNTGAPRQSFSETIQQLIQNNQSMRTSSIEVHKHWETQGRLSESCIVIGQRTSSIEVHKHWETQGNAAESCVPVSEIRRKHHTCAAQLRLISHFVMPQ